MMEPTAAGAASSPLVSLCPPVRQSVCLRLGLGSSYSSFLSPELGVESAGRIYYLT